jgi:cell division protein YceG involved in septum cleavage
MTCDALQTRQWQASLSMRHASGGLLVSSLPCPITLSSISAVPAKPRRKSPALWPRILLLAVLTAVAWLSWVVVIPADLPQTPYKLTIGPNRTLGQVARGLSEEGVIRNRNIMMLLGRMQGMDRKIKAGLYQFSDSASMWDILQRLADGHPDEASLTLIEGWNFRQFRQAIRPQSGHQARRARFERCPVVAATGAGWRTGRGLFFPSTYLFTPAVAIWNSIAAPTTPCSKSWMLPGLRARPICHITRRMSC